MDGYFDRYAAEYDRMQPIAIEMYRFYHSLALDLVPFETRQSFRFLDLGCGTGTFMAMILDRFPNSTATAIDLYEEMLQEARAKTADSDGRAEYRQHDLSNPIPADLNDFDLVVSFSALHHLQESRKTRIAEEIYATLKPGGWLILLDAMYVPYAPEVWKIGLEREKTERVRRFAESDTSPSEYQQYESAKHALAESSPERDRLSSMSDQIDNLRGAGFASVDTVWHFWMEHLVIAQK